MTKGAIVNLCNRYRAVLKKCHVNNMLVKMFIAGTIVLAVPTLAEAGENTQTIDGKDIYKVIGPDLKPATGDVSADNVNISVTKSDIETNVFGSRLRPVTGSASAKQSEVSLSSGTSVGYSVYGQYLKTDSAAASAEDSKVTISSGSSVGSYVYGQYLETGSGSAAAPVWWCKLI